MQDLLVSHFTHNLLEFFFIKESILKAGKISMTTMTMGAGPFTDVQMSYCKKIEKEIIFDPVK